MLSLDDLVTQVVDNLQNETVHVWAKLHASASALVNTATAGGHEDAANKAWFIRKTIEMRREYLAAIDMLRHEDYYEAWCSFEQIEIGLRTQKRNPFYSCDQFGIDALAEQVTQWQSLFPYKIFFSPETIIRRETCSICGETASPWSNCNHLPGRVYGGLECHRLVEDFEFVSVSMVTNPVQKYSVARVMHERADGKIVDQFDYLPVKFVVDRILTPFAKWRAEKTTILEPHSAFGGLTQNDECPCDSGKFYFDCCLQKEGVRTPHIHFDFLDPIRKDLPTFVKVAGT